MGKKVFKDVSGLRNWMNSGIMCHSDRLGEEQVKVGEVRVIF